MALCAIAQDHGAAAALLVANRSYHSCLRATTAMPQQMTFTPAELSRLLAHMTQQQQQQQPAGQMQYRGQAPQSQSKAQRQSNERPQQPQQTQYGDWLMELYSRCKREAIGDDKILGKGARPW